MLTDFTDATAMLRTELARVHLNVHRRKSRFVASSGDLQDELVRRLRKFHVQGARTERNFGIDFSAAKCHARPPRKACKAPALARARKILSLKQHVQKRRTQHMVQTAPLASFRYWGTVCGTNCGDLRCVRALHAHAQAQNVSGRSLSLFSHDVRGSSLRSSLRGHFL